MIRVALLVLVVAGCTDVELTSQVESYDLRSGCLTCSNSPVVDSYRFHEMSKVGAPNQQGLRIIGFYLPSGAPATLDVVNGRILGRVGPFTYAGSTGPFALTGAVISITDGVRRYAVRLETISSLSSVARNPVTGAAATIEAYRLGWTAWGGTWPPSYNTAPVCPDFVFENDDVGLPWSFATVFEGDRISAHSYSVVGFDRNWFNIGCAGHLIAKMAFTNHTYAAQSQGFVTTQDERTTMIKMLAADYCGVGMPFTVPGVPLTWEDDRDWMAAIPTVIDVEAEWGPTGAQCMNVPRCDSAATDECLDDFPGPKSVKSRVAELCKLPPPCEGRGAHLTSLNRE